MIAFYGRTLKFVLRFQTITLLVAVGTLVLTIFLYIVVPKGFFPVQDTGVIQGISQAPETISFPAMAREAAGTGEGDPRRSRCREPLLVHRRGRHEHHAEQRALLHQPEAAFSARSATPRMSFAGCKAKLQNVEGIKLFMQPVQNITVDDRVSRTQYQYTLEDPDPNELNLWTNRFVEQTEEAAATRRRGHRPADRRPGCFADDRPRHRFALWVSRLPPSTTRSMTPTASARSTPCTRSSTSTT